MNPVVVRYKTKPESADENQRLVEAVFREIAEKSPAGLQYATLRLDDGASFVHIASVTTADGSNPLDGIEAFAKFQEGIRERCVEPPALAKASVVGNHGLLAE